MVYNRPGWPQLIGGHCVLCLGRDASGLDLCPHCLADLPWLGPACPACALPAPDGQLCGACQRRSPGFDTCRALFAYATPIDGLVQRLKFRADLQLARLLGRLMADHLALGKQPDCILPVPLHPARQRERGFNQALELARPLAARLACRLDVLTCIRARPTPSQSQQPSAEERRRNLRNAFALRRPLTGCHVAIVDDVMTTGSTLGALAAQLREAGAARIDVWVCARTIKR